MTWIPDQWMLFILNYIIHSAVLISMVFILIRFRPFSELKMREGLWKFALVAGIITTLIQSYGNTSLLIISAAPVHQVASNSDS